MAYPNDIPMKVFGVNAHWLTWRDLPQRWKNRLIEATGTDHDKVRVETTYDCARDEKLLAFFWHDKLNNEVSFRTTAREAIANTDETFNLLCVKLRVSGC